MLLAKWVSRKGPTLKAKLTIQLNGNSSQVDRLFVSEESKRGFITWRWRCWPQGCRLQAQETLVSHARSAEAPIFIGCCVKRLRACVGLIPK